MRFVSGIYSIVLLVVFGFGIYVLQYVGDSVAHFSLRDTAYGSLSRAFTEGSIVFVPDIMLGRTVDATVAEVGLPHLLRNVADIVREADLTVGNFEAAVPTTHVPTGSGSMRFSVPRTYLDDLYNVGFDVLSLANNHALDHGYEGYQSTRSYCTDTGLVCVGHPTMLTQDSYTVRDVGDVRVGILMLHTLFEAPSTTIISARMDELRSQSDYQVAFVHWGDEYVPIHSAAQESLAHTLIEYGADAVIGHHPHVIQDAALYQGKPIFYSLGNFIFDQYFSEDVQTGYMIELTLTKRDAVFKLLPYSTVDERLTPTLLEQTDAQKLFAHILPHTYFSKETQERGIVIVPRD